jgi:hypothetical protein
MVECFAVIGRSPVCGCPMAIDLSLEGGAARDFEERGLLIEIVPSSMATSIWENASWPCPHFRSSVSEVQKSNQFISETLCLSGEHISTEKPSRPSLDSRETPLKLLQLENDD